MLDRIYGWSQLVTICSSPQVFAGLCAFFSTPFFLQFLIPVVRWLVKYNMVNWYMVASIVVILFLTFFIIKKNRQENIKFGKKDFIALFGYTLFSCCYFYIISYML